MGKFFDGIKFIYNKNGDLVEQLEYGDESDNPLIKIIYKYEEH